MKKFVLFILIPFSIISFPNNSMSQELIKWQDCVKIAKKTHPDLKSAEEKISQAKANTGIAGSGLLPQVDATAELSKSKYEAGGRSQTDDSVSYGVTGKQLLFDGGQAIYDVKSSKKQAEASEYNYQVVSATIRQNLRYAFVRLLSAQELVKINKEIAKIRKQNLDLVRMRYASGMEHKGSLLTAEANKTQADYQVLQSERSIVLQQRSLNINMGLDKLNQYVAGGELAVPDAYIEKPNLELIADSNPQLKNIIQQRIAAEYNLKSSEMDYSPKLFGFLNANRSDYKGLPADNRISGGIQMNFNIFQGGKNHYQNEYAEALLKQFFADERSTHNTILLFLEQTWTNLRGNVDSVTIQENFLKAAEERAKIADSQYSIGAISFDNWTIIQDNLVNAKQNIINAETNALLSEADWIQAKGGTLDYE